MEELKPCPFCGSTELQRRGNSDIEYMNGYIECIKCHAYGPSANSSALGTAKTSEEVWNARAEQVDAMPLPLDADGVPIRIGDEVYLVPSYADNPPKRRVVGITIKQNYAAIMTDCDGARQGFEPHQLMHKNPDSWVKLEDDIEKSSCDYFGKGESDSCTGCRAFEGNLRCTKAQAVDIIARAKRLVAVEVSND